MKNEILQEIENRDRAVFFVDPHGPDALDLLDAIPSDLTEKTVFLDASDPNYAVGFNPNVAPVHALSSLKAIWAKDWGPRMNHILRNTLMLLHENPGSTFEDIPPIFYDSAKRARLVRNVQRLSTRRFWQPGGEFERKYERARDNPDSAILNKVGEILSSNIVRNLCQRTPRLDFATALRNNFVVIVNLSKPTIGDEAAAILGSLFITSLRAALLVNPTACSVWVDEFQTLGASMFGAMLSEMRKFGLKLGLAQQYISQVDEQLQRAILGNVGHKVIFEIDYADAVILARSYDRLHQEFNPAAFTEVPPYHAYYDGQLMQLPDFDPRIRGRRDIVMLRSRENFGRRL